MKRKEIVEVDVVYCDVCGDKCDDYVMSFDKRLVEKHACLLNEAGEQCAEILAMRIGKVGNLVIDIPEDTSHDEIDD